MVAPVKHALIVGAGYIGIPLGQALARQGFHVTGWVANQASATKVRQAGLTPFAGDASNPQTWEKIESLPWDTVYFTAAASGGGPESYSKVYGEALNLALSHKPPNASFFYTSSTSVYAQLDGAWVDESSPIMPTSPTGKILATAESRVLDAGGSVARLSALYGPSRHVLLDRLLSGSAVIDGDGSRWINHIHRDDAVDALLFLQNNQPLANQLVNISDSEPATLLTFYQWLCKRFNKSLPPYGEVPPTKRGRSSKRVSSNKLQNTGYRFRFPTFREGYEALSTECF